MKGLLLKDFINLKKNFKIFGLLSIIYIVLAVASKDTGFFNSIITMLFAILTMSLFSYDDMAKWEIYGLTMPITREDMVKNKYAMLLLLTMFGIAFSSIISIGINIVLKKENLFASISNSFIGAFVVIVLYSIVLPIIIKLGVEKARIIILIIMVVPFAVVSAINAYLKEGFSVATGSLATLLYSTSSYSYFLLPVIALLILYLSYRISVGIYRKKDF